MLPPSQHYETKYVSFIKSHKYTVLIGNVFILPTIVRSYHPVIAICQQNEEVNNDYAYHLRPLKHSSFTPQYEPTKEMKKQLHDLPIFIYHTYTDTI